MLKIVMLKDKIKDEIKQIWDNAKKDAKKDGMQYYEKIKLHPLRCLIIILFFILVFILILWTLIELPPRLVSHFDINNASQEATIENQYRATIAQILGGSVVVIGIYFAWGNLITAREGQITERFTRAVDQLGNKKLEIRLGGIYALERISNESEKDYWPIMEILTAYIRNNSSAEIFENKKVTHLAMDIQANKSTTSEIQEVKEISLDIQAILTVLGRRKHSFKNGEANRLDLNRTYLGGAKLELNDFNGAIFYRANLKGAHLIGAHLNETYFVNAELERADLYGAHLNGAVLNGADLYGANLNGAKLKGAELERTELERADLYGAELEEAKLKGATNLTVYQLSEVKTLYHAELDKNLEVPLRERHLDLFENPHEFQFFEHKKA